MAVRARTGIESQPSRPVLPVVKPGRIPPLENGDRLSRREFERRYAAMSKVNKAELIERVVHMPSPVRTDLHGFPHGLLIGWIVAYHAATPGLVLSDNGTLRLDADNEVQPDVLLVIKASGQARIEEDGYVRGAPEFIAEVASSSASYDAHEKFNVYRRRCGVQEYLLWRTQDGQMDWWALNEGVYEPLPADESGIVASRVFPGLWLDVNAMLAGDVAQALAVLQTGLASAEHSTFVDRVTHL